MPGILNFDKIIALAGLIIETQAMLGLALRKESLCARLFTANLEPVN